MVWFHYLLMFYLVGWYLFYLLTYRYVQKAKEFSRFCVAFTWPLLFVLILWKFTFQALLPRLRSWWSS